MPDTNQEIAPINVDQDCPTYSNELIEISDDESDTAHEDDAKDANCNMMDYHSFCLQISAIIPPFAIRYILKLQKKADSSPGSFFMRHGQGGLSCADVKGILDNDLISGKAMTIWYQLLHEAYPNIGVTESTFAELDMVIR